MLEPWLEGSGTFIFSKKYLPCSCDSAILPAQRLLHVKLHYTNTTMRQSPILSIATKFVPITSSKGRLVGTMTPRKQTNTDAGEGCVLKDNAEPMVAFSRPPPGPPVLGSLFALSVLDYWIKRDKRDD